VIGGRGSAYGDKPQCWDGGTALLTPCSDDVKLSQLGVPDCPPSAALLFRHGYAVGTTALCPGARRDHDVIYLILVT